jgi:hypothetical protein
MNFRTLPWGPFRSLPHPAETLQDSPFLPFETARAHRFSTSLAVLSGSKQVYVYLDPAGKVVSWQEPHITKVPVPASRAPFPATGPTHVLLNDAVKPNAELTGLPSTCGYQPAQSGGLQLQFLRRVYDGNGLYKLVASDVSPASVSSGSSAGLDCSGNSGLLQLNFQVYQIAPDGKPNYLNISLRVRPRY